MHKIMNIKKILIFQIIIIMVFTMILNIFTSKVIGYTVTHNQTKLLQHTTQEWHGMNLWQEKLIHTLETEYIILQKLLGNVLAVNLVGGYACASYGAIAYFADPRNFLTEDRNIPVHGNDI